MADPIRRIGYPLTFIAAIAVAALLSISGSNACTGPQDSEGSAFSVPIDQAELTAELHLNGQAVDLTDGAATEAALQAQLVALVDDLPPGSTLDTLRARLATVAVSVHVNSALTVLVGGVPVRGSASLDTVEGSEVCVTIPPLLPRCQLATW